MYVHKYCTRTKPMYLGRSLGNSLQCGAHGDLIIRTVCSVLCTTLICYIHRCCPKVYWILYIVADYLDRDVFFLFLFLGVYLPLLWEQSFCWKSPIALGYTRGHFSALVAMENDGYDNRGAGANLNTDDDVTVTFLPLVDSERKLLHIHFLSAQEVRTHVYPILRHYFFLHWYIRGFESKNIHNWRF